MHEVFQCEDDGERGRNGDRDHDVGDRDARGGGMLESGALGQLAALPEEDDEEGDDDEIGDDAHDGSEARRKAVDHEIDSHVGLMAYGQDAAEHGHVDHAVDGDFLGGGRGNFEHVAEKHLLENEQHHEGHGDAADGSDEPVKAV